MTPAFSRAVKLCTSLGSMIVLLGTGASSVDVIGADAPAKIIPLTQAPLPVQKAIQSQLRGAKLQSIEQISEDGEVSYQAVIMRAGEERDLIVAADGTILSIELGLSETPPDVQKTIKAQLGRATIENIDKVFDDGEVTYEIEMTKDGQRREFTVGADGTLLNIDISLAEAPAAVQKTVSAQLAGGALVNIEKSLEDGETIYEIEFQKNGKDRSMSVAEDGKLLSIEVGLQETPAVVQRTIQGQIARNVLKCIDKIFDNGQISYEVEVTTPEKWDRSFTVAGNGKLESIEISLEETTPAARKTITNKIADGKLVRIDKTFGDNNRFTFEVSVRKDGKTSEFVVGPRGRVQGTGE